MSTENFFFFETEVKTLPHSVIKKKFDKIRKGEKLQQQHGIMLLKFLAPMATHNFASFLIIS
jgi:hypothetical protein